MGFLWTQDSKPGRETSIVINIFIDILTINTSLLHCRGTVTDSIKIMNSSCMAYLPNIIWTTSYTFFTISYVTNIQWKYLYWVSHVLLHSKNHMSISKESSHDIKSYEKYWTDFDTVFITVTDQANWLMSSSVAMGMGAGRGPKPLAAD